MESNLYHYRAKVVGCYDADTITVDIDLGFNQMMIGQKVRLYGINAPELRGDNKIAGKTARDFLRSQILEKNVILRTHRDKVGKYGRWLAEVYLDQLNINQLLVNNGFAVVANY